MLWTPTDSKIFLPNLLLITLVALGIAAVNFGYFHLFQIGQVSDAAVKQVSDGSKNITESFLSEISPAIPLSTLNDTIDYLDRFIQTTQKNSLAIERSYRLVTDIGTTVTEIVIFAVFTIGAFMTFEALRRVDNF